MKTDKQLQQLNTIEAAVQGMLRRLSDLQQQLEGLKAENRQLRESLEERNSEIKNFQNQENITKIVDSMAAADAGNTAELKWKINEYIREIDKCISHLKD